MILSISSMPKPRRVVVRTFPSDDTFTDVAVAVSSSGARMIATMS
jgi:hypothetical protein